MSLKRDIMDAYYSRTKSLERLTFITEQPLSLFLFLSLVCTLFCSFSFNCSFSFSFTICLSPFLFFYFSLSISFFLFSLSLSLACAPLRSVSGSSTHPHWAQHAMCRGKLTAFSFIFSWKSCNIFICSFKAGWRSNLLAAINTQRHGPNHSVFHAEGQTVLFMLNMLNFSPALF